MEDLTSNKLDKIRKEGKLKHTFCLGGHLIEHWVYQDKKYVVTVEESKE